MINRFKHHLLPSLFGIFLSFPLSVTAATDLNIADVPLSVISSVQPNVMLLLDNSGSMDNIVWYVGRGKDTADPDYIPEFDPATNYDDWSNGGRWTATATFMTLASINGGGGNQDGSCATQNTIADATVTVKEIVNGKLKDVDYTVPRYVIQGQNDSGVTHCLILPDILDKGTTRYTGNYLNYLFQYFADGADLTKIIPFKTRMIVMQDVTNDLVSTTAGMRFGLTVFDNGDGGEVLVGCDKPNTDVTNQIATLNAGGSTPLAESMYEITRYFRGMPAFYTNDTFKSPIQYSCQKNFVIAVTDGLPTSDTKFDTADKDLSGGTLPNWDGLNTTPRFSDTGSLFFDDIAKFAYDTDMKTGDDFEGTQNIETYAVGFSIANQMLRDAGHYGSGLTSADPETTPDPANYFTANNEQQLRDDLEAALTSIEGKISSAASIAASTGFVGAGTSLFQGVFETNTWTGNLVRHDLILNPDNTVSIVESTIDATSVLTDMIESKIPRHIISYNPDTATGIDFEWDNLTTSQKALLADREEILDYLRGDQSCEVSQDDNPGCTTPKNKNLRDRNIGGTGFLGTIINSTPIHIAKPLEFYPSLWGGKDAPENADGAEKYADFKTAHEKRKGIVYVGANDGMLHAFDGGHLGNPFDPESDPPVAPTMEEKFAYIPAAVYPNLAAYADQTHTHRYYVDGTPNVIDVFFGDSGGDKKWHTVLVGGLNKGGQGIYALDITNPETFSGDNAKNNVLWEFTDNEDRDLGYTFSRPAIIRMHNGQWAAVFGNGYNSTEIDDGDSNGDGVTDINDDTAKNDSETGNAVLYIVNIRTGELISKIDTLTGAAQDPTKNNRPNGLSTVAPVDIDDDFIVDYIYAGDLFGNLWRFDVTGITAGSWTILGKGNPANQEPIFIAKDSSSGTTQPITARPEASITSSGGLMVYFGTGQYIQLADKTDKSIQSFYGLLDNPVSDKNPSSKPVQVTRTEMIQQTIDAELTFTSAKGTEEVRQFSKEAGDNYASWYLDLIVASNKPPAQGERVVGPPIVRGISRKKIVFTSIIPTEDVCGFGGKSWLIELDARNGNRTTRPVFDLNFDGKLDNLDNSGNDVNNGWAQKGIQTTPAILTGKGIEFKILSGSSGELRAVGEEPPPERDGDRQSWRQVK